MKQNILKKLEFDNDFPQIPSSKLFSERYEVNYVMKQGAEHILLPQIPKLFPNAKIKREIIATTYFEPILRFQPKKSCIVRFRQRILNDSHMKTPIFPEKWTLGGPGTLELKIRNLEKQSRVTKEGTFLPDHEKKDIYELLRLAKELPYKHTEFNKFIQSANVAQMSATDNEYLHQINPSTFSDIAPYLSPFATRVNIRHTLETKTTEEVRITLETHPTFYAYPIEHKQHEQSKSKKTYEAIMGEVSERSKIEIKTESKKENEGIQKKLAKYTEKLKVPNNKYSKKPYSKMVLEASKKAGTLVVEKPSKEIEVKAEISKGTDIESLINRLRNELIVDTNSPYKLFLTDPEVGRRDYAEKDRTVFGWKNFSAVWHEVVTIIRLKRARQKEYGFSAILKWKADPKERNSNVLNRTEKLEHINKPVTNRQLIRQVNKNLGKKVEKVGVFTKKKYRILVQDKEGRNFNVSLDKVTIKGTKEIMKQLEIEYIHTVHVDSEKPKITVEESCTNCMDYFLRILDGLSVKAKRTNVRKIDFFCV